MWRDSLRRISKRWEKIEQTWKSFVMNLNVIVTTSQQPVLIGMTETFVTHSLQNDPPAESCCCCKMILKSDHVGLIKLKKFWPPSYVHTNRAFRGLKAQTYTVKTRLHFLDLLVCWCKKCLRVYSSEHKKVWNDIGMPSENTGTASTGRAPIMNSLMSSKRHYFFFFLTLPKQQENKIENIILFYFTVNFDQSCGMYVVSYQYHHHSLSSLELLAKIRDLLRFLLPAFSSAARLGPAWA